MSDKKTSVDSEKIEQIYKIVEQNISQLKLPLPNPCLELNVALDVLETSMEAPTALLDNTNDMSRLMMIADSLNGVRNDAQQRSWELFDDKGTILEYLKELKSILTDADESVTKRFLNVNEYSVVNCLAEYYQMESRWPIKEALLESLNSLCTLSKISCVILLQSVLPLELTRDLQSLYENHFRLILAVEVFIKLLSVGEPLPNIYFDTIGKEFLKFLLRFIEDPKNFECDDVIEKFINLILVYNLQFDSVESINENKTIQALLECENPKLFSETLLLLINRGNDPINYHSETAYPPNSVLKIINDLFTHDQAWRIFYNNDVKVLIDIVLRHLTDNTLESKERFNLLTLLSRILRKTEKSVYEGQMDNIITCISRLSDQGDSNFSSLIDNIISQFSKVEAV